MRSDLLTVLAAGFAVSASAQQATSITKDNGLPAGSLSGSQAIRAHADNFAEIAADLGVTEETLAQRLRSDLSTYITPAGDVFNVCPKAPDNNDDDNNSFTPTLAGLDIPLDDFLDLESNPGASKTIYLDFTGHHSVGNRWGHNIQFPAWDTEGDPGFFSDNEKFLIIQHWLEVVEDFAQFDANVTTKDPGLAALTKSGSSDQNYGMRCVMTQPTNGFGDSFGGVAYLNSFNDSTDNPCFTINKGLNAGPMTVSHEVGHTFGLFHDGLNSQEYHPGIRGNGTASWGPIMGAPFGKHIVQWCRGDYPGSTTTQNDLSVITNNSNRINVIADDHPSSIFSGTPLSVGTPAAGVITTSSDTDSFTVDIPSAGDYVISVKNADVGPNLVARFEIYRDSPFQFISSEEPDESAEAIQVLSLDPGQYTIVVDGTFQAMNTATTSDYGSVGAFTLAVDTYVPPQPITITYPNGLPTQLTENTATDILINIDPGSETLDTDELFMLYAINFIFSFNRVDLVPQGGNNYIATLPAGACDDEFFFNFTITPTTTGVIYDPADPLDSYSATVVCNFECVADVNGDGSLTAADFTAWIAAFNANAPECDQNDDGSCTAADFTAWIANFNAGC